MAKFEARAVWIAAYIGFILPCTNSLSFMARSNSRSAISTSLSARSEARGEDITGLEQSRRTVLQRMFFGTGSAAAGATLMTAMAAWSASPAVAEARLESVNRPDLLPSEPGLNVIQTEKFLTTGQAKRMNDLLKVLERDTGYRLRVLCQSYPNTPGLAIRDYWNVGKEDQLDDKYIVLVVDQFGGKANILNFNVGEGVKFALPNVFWTRLQGKYGTTFYVRDNGIDLAIINAVEAIATCLRSEEKYCVQVPDAAPSLRSLGMM